MNFLIGGDKVVPVNNPRGRGRRSGFREALDWRIGKPRKPVKYEGFRPCQPSTTERIAAISGPAYVLPTWNPMIFFQTFHKRCPKL